MTSYTLFSDSQFCRTALAGSPEAQRAVSDGYAELAAGFASQLEAWTFGAASHGLFAEDYDDRMLPVACLSKRRLFRSVSPGELADIATRGAVFGGGNGFNGFDRRPFVFFSPEASAACIGQGEDLDRQAEYIVVAEAGGRAAVTPLNVDVLRERHRAELARLREETAEAVYTSAVIETQPVGPSLHYSTEHGRTGMNGEDEYGLFPGQVKLADIAAVHLVRRGTVVEMREQPCWDTLLKDFASQREVSPGLR